MKRRTIAFFMALSLLVLAGCNNTPTKEEQPQTVSFSESDQDSLESESTAEEENSEVETMPDAVHSDEPDQKSDITEKDTVTSEQPQTFSDTGQTAPAADLPKETDKTEQPIPKPNPKPNLSVSEQTESKAPEQEETPPAVTEPPTENTETPSAAFDIDHWIAFAKEYAQKVGLELDSEAVYCWDNPLGAGAHSKYLERDITACLNRYAKDEDISAVWIWAEKIGENTYELYIGYA